MARTHICLIIAILIASLAGPPALGQERDWYYWGPREGGQDAYEYGTNDDAYAGGYDQELGERTDAWGDWEDDYEAWADEETTEDRYDAWQRGYDAWDEDGWRAESDEDERRATSRQRDNGEPYHEYLGYGYGGDDYEYGEDDTLGEMSDWGYGLDYGDRGVYHEEDRYEGGWHYDYDWDRDYYTENYYTDDWFETTDTFDEWYEEN
jgi:hypothetical protein